MTATYPYSSKDRLVAADLNSDLELNPNSVPPSSAFGGAHIYKQWIDTSVTPPVLRMCVANPASATYNAPDWIALATIDTTNKHFGVASVILSDTAPPSPLPGLLWWDSLGGNLYVSYFDGNSTQWVPATNTSGLPVPITIANGGTGATTASQALVNLGAAPVGTIAARPNKLINPFMEIDQANEGGFVGAASGPYAVDGFKATLSSSAGGVGGAQRGTSGAAPGYGYYLSYATTTAASSVGAADVGILYQYLEADELCDTVFGTAGAQPLTLSFWAYSSISGTYYVRVANAANNRSYVAPYTISTASTWQLFTITVPGDTTGTWVTSGNATGMIITWTLGAGTNYQTASPNSWQAGNFYGATGMSNAFMTTAGASFRLGPAKLEVGPNATPMLRQSFQSELSRCQRYYEKSYDIGTAVATPNGTSSTCGYSTGYATTPTVSLGFSFKANKRATPSVTCYSSGTGAAGKVSMNGADVAGSFITGGTTQMALYATASGTAANWSFHWVADARL